MAVDWNEIAPPVIGGLIICLGITLHLWLSKRLTSLSEMIHQLLAADMTNASFLAGIVFASTVVWNIYGYGAIKDTKIVPFESEGSFLGGLGIYGFMFSGFLVGLGTKLAGGGLTGHAFCGIPRFSIKSLIAVATFLGTAFLVATSKRKFSTLTGHSMDCATMDVNPHITANIFLVTAVVVLVVCIIRKDQTFGSVTGSFVSGVILAIGLMVSGLAQRSKMLEFLTFKEHWNSFLLIAIAAAIVGNLITFNLFLRKHEGENAKVHFFDVVIGSIFFGAGLGLSGLTPGTALLVSPVYFPEILVFFLLPAAFGNQISGYVFNLLSVCRDSTDRYVRHD